MLADERLFHAAMLAAYREVAPEGSVGAEFMVRKLSTAMYARGGRIEIGRQGPPVERFIHHSLDAGHCIVWTCNVWNQVLGTHSYNIVGHHVAEFFTPDALEVFKHYWPRLLQDGKVSDVPLTILTAGGIPLRALWKSEVLRNENGTFDRTFDKIKVFLPAALVEVVLSQAG